MINRLNYIPTLNICNKNNYKYRIMYKYIYFIYIIGKYLRTENHNMITMRCHISYLMVSHIILDPYYPI